VEKMRHKKGQSILEYVVVLTVIVAAILAGVTMFAKKGDSARGVGKLMDKAGGTIDQAGNDLTNKLKVIE
jgi:uncharacterized protein (UPF0333 family)